MGICKRCGGKAELFEVICTQCERTLANEAYEAKVAETPKVDKQTDGPLPGSTEANSEAGNTSTPHLEITDDYSTGRGVAAFVGIMGWLTVVAGFLISLAGASSGGGLIAALPGIAIIIGGFVQVMIAQLVTATFDNATHTKRMVAILESKQ
jgi:hypothetical protein